MNGFFIFLLTVISFSSCHYGCFADILHFEDDTEIPNEPYLTTSFREYIVAPGYIDVSQLVFWGDEGIFGDQGSTIDIVAFRQQDECSSSPWSKCDWSQVGVGSSVDGLDCCSEYAAYAGVCNLTKPYERDTRHNRLILDQDSFQGGHWAVNITDMAYFHTPGDSGEDSGDDESNSNNGGSTRLHITKSGYYVVAMANCNPEGREVLYHGNLTMKSNIGYLPGTLIGVMDYYTFFAIINIALAVWYTMHMCYYNDSVFGIQKWTAVAICLGVMHSLVALSRYVYWNEVGSFPFLYEVEAYVLMALKLTLSRCLLVMVSLGWGVIQADLSVNRWCQIGLLGFGYAFVVTTNLFLTRYRPEISHKKMVFQNIDTALEDFVHLLQAILEVIFAGWILFALYDTLRKLGPNDYRRFQILRLVFILCALFGFGIWIWENYYNYESKMIGPKQTWIIPALQDLPGFIVLITIAILWKPHDDTDAPILVSELSMISHSDHDNDEVYIENDDNIQPSAASSGINRNHSSSKKRGIKPTSSDQLTTMYSNRDNSPLSTPKGSKKKTIGISSRGKTLVITEDTVNYRTDTSEYSIDLL